jgi:hypothetical protein
MKKAPRNVRQGVMYALPNQDSDLIERLYN